MKNESKISLVAKPYTVYFRKFNLFSNESIKIKLIEFSVLGAPWIEVRCLLHLVSSLYFYILFKIQDEFLKVKLFFWYYTFNFHKILLFCCLCREAISFWKSLKVSVCPFSSHPSDLFPPRPSFLFVCFAPLYPL